MARLFLTNIDLNWNAKLVKASLDSTAPVTAAAGNIWYDSTGNTLKVGTGAGTSALLTKSGFITNSDLSGSAGITNANLANSSVTVNGTAISLGGSGTITAANPNALTNGTGIASLSYTGASTATVSVDTTVVATTSNSLTLSNKTIAGTGLSFAGSTSGATNLLASAAAGTTTITLPATTGTVITTGDTGTVTSTMIADGTIVNADINASAAIAISKLAASTISGVSLGNNLNALTIGTGLSGTSYNGSSAVTIAIDSTVATLTGSQTLTNKTLGATSMTGALAMGSNKITGLADPTNPQDAATKNYVDAAVVGIDWKPSVRVATTTAGTLATSFANASTVDGVTLATGDRILIKNQATGSENGIYVVAASGAPTRATDADTNTEVTGGFAVFVEEGTTNADTGWVLTNNGSITIGSTALTFTQFSGTGTYTNGTGITLTGNVFALDTTVATTASNTQTFTNKTYDTAGSGNVFRINGTAISAVTGTGSVVLASSPTLVTPTLGVASATSINKVAITAPATSATLTIADGKTLTASNTLTFSGTDGSTLNIGTGGTLGTGAYATIANYAPLASPTFTGTPAAPTATAGTNTTQIATTAFVTTAVAAAGTVKKYSAANGALTATSGQVTWTVNHALATSDVIVQVYRQSDKALVDVDVVTTDSNNVTLTLISGNLTGSEYRVVVLG
jgi:hypothetical protein